MHVSARHYETGEPIRIAIRGERIQSVEPAWPEGDVDDWPWVAPGLFDLQINGINGTWFSQAGLAADDVLAALAAHFRVGITRMLPTLVTNSFEALASGLAAIRAACEREAWASRMAPGCHLEGPHISPEDGPRGAHPLKHVRPCDWDEFQRLQEIAGGRIRLVTLAPEQGGAIEFVERAVASGVVVAVGHTAATPEQITAAVDAGAKLSTHLGNGAHGTLRRHPNYLWEQLGEPRLTASIITDGHHLPDSVIRSIVGAKNVRRTIITCDAAGYAGCPPGAYTSEWGSVEILDDGRIVVAGQRQFLAGSGSETDACVAYAMKAAGVSLKDAIDMAGRNPARLLGYEEVRLRRGSRADLWVFQRRGEAFETVATVLAGEVRFGRLARQGETSGGIPPAGRPQPA
jgi:N-acetylglucosamine-6-phosphate deacetylase